MWSDMFSNIYATYGEDYWELRDKVTFDGENSLIIVNEGETEINIQADIYSAWKDWALLRDYLKFRAALRTTGGDPLPSGDALGATFFLINGWQIFLDHAANFTGNIFNDLGGDVFVTAADLKVATTTVSNLIDKVNLSGGDGFLASDRTTLDTILSQTTADAIADAVWDALAVDYTATGATGELLNNIPGDVADTVWDETASDHNAPGSMGEKQNTSTVDQDGIADAVWDAQRSDHNTAGTFGEGVATSGGGAGGGSVVINVGHADDNFRMLSQDTNAGPAIIVEMGVTTPTNTFKVIKGKTQNTTTDEVETGTSSAKSVNIETGTGNS